MRKTLPALAVLALLCCGPAANAAPLDLEEVFFGRAAALLSNIATSAVDRLRHIWAEEGGAWDPNGRPTPPPAGAAPQDAPPAT